MKIGGRRQGERESVGKEKSKEKVKTGKWRKKRRKRGRGKSEPEGEEEGGRECVRKREGDIQRQQNEGKRLCRMLHCYSQTDPVSK